MDWFLYEIGLRHERVKLVHDYLLNREQRTKVSSKYSSWAHMLEGFSQGSILGTLQFNIFLCDLFIITDTALNNDRSLGRVRHNVKKTF